MKKFFTFAVLAVMGLGMVGCDADIPSDDEIPEVQADPAQVQRSMEEMMKRRQAGAQGNAEDVDLSEAAKTTTGGN